MTKTRIDVINSALLMLKACSRGFDAKSFDVELVGDIYDGLHTRLEITNKIYWSINCVPIESFGPISAILAGTVLAEGNDFGLDDTTQAKIRGNHDKGTAEINEIRTSGFVPNGEPTPAQYF